MPVSYEIELGYIPHQFYIENSYLAFRDLPLAGEFKFGQFQNPDELDAVTSSRDITMMELAAPACGAGSGRSTPAFKSASRCLTKRATWKFGLFTAGTSQDTGDASKDYGRAITRITGLPIYEVDPSHPNSATLLHLGLSANILYLRQRLSALPGHARKVISRRMS
jgi:phosphate-selective porin